MGEWLVSHFSDFGLLYIVAYFAIQVLLYVQIFRKFEAPAQEAFKASLWSTVNFSLVVLAIIVADRAETIGASFLQNVIGISIFFLTFYFVTYAKIYPVIEMYLVEPGQDPNIYRLPFRLGDGLALPVGNWPLSLFVLIAPRRWITGFVVNEQFKYQAAPAGSDLVIRPADGWNRKAILLVAVLESVFLFLASLDDVSTYHVYAMYGLAVWLPAEALWRMTPNGQKILIINRNGFSIPRRYLSGRKFLRWSNVDRAEPFRHGIRVYRKEGGFFDPVNLLLCGHNPKEIATLMNRNMSR